MKELDIVKVSDILNLHNIYDLIGDALGTKMNSDSEIFHEIEEFIVEKFTEMDFSEKGLEEGQVKVEVDFNYEGFEFTVVGIADQDEIDDAIERGFNLVGYIEGGDMMVDVEGFDVHTIIEGREKLNAYYKFSEDSNIMGNSSYKILED